ncbi:MAG: class I tRNA ligase family protein [bacterium]
MEPSKRGGVHRFLSRVWRLFCGDDGLSDKVSPQAASADTLRELHKTIKKVTEDTEELRFNTAIASMMEFVNYLYKLDAVPHEVVAPFVQILGPYAPHLTEEIWQRLGNTESISLAAWPTYDESLLVSASYPLAVQIMGKLRATVDCPTDADEATAVAIAQQDDNVQKHLEGKTIRKIVFVKGRILNFVAN